jgi:3'-phosphoadenosine 5'-phosphosulfate sulfotransferase (PAPS reductase)/FAD synthetase
MFDAIGTDIEYVDISNTTNFADLENEFASASAVDSIDPIVELEQEAIDAFEQAVASIKTIRAKRVCQIATSFGKDSSLLLLASLEAHKQLIKEGTIAQDAPFIVSTIDTKVENHLMKILVSEEVERLTNYCQKNNINLDMLFATPPLSKTWASLFLSGHKMLSTARLNNDCSVILKINSSERIEKNISTVYGDVAILVGSRQDESLRRSQSLQKRNQFNRDAEDFLTAVEAGREENVFAPISHITTDQVWMLLRRAGTSPMVKPTLPSFSLPSYAENHLLLAIIYGDSTDATCPTTSKKVTGQGVGGCGKSSRTGCSLCLKVFNDTSGEAQNKMERHSVISGNILKVRNYMAFVAEDMSKRSWHTRAIDQTTGAIAAYPNVLNAQTIDELIKLLIQCSVDEVFRAKQFKARVAAGDEMLDKGYANIFNDPSLSESERDLFADVYLRHAQEPLHAPIDHEICMYLSLIHSRDGMKLPPYRAIALWKQLYTDFIDDVNEKIYEEYARNNYINIEDAHKFVVKEYEKQGIRLPYPDVDITKAPQEEAPDAVMVMPENSLAEFDYVPHTGLFNADDVVGCMVDIEHDKIKLPLTQASKLLPSDHEVTEQSVMLRGFKMDNTFNVFRSTRANPKAKKEFSKRGISKVSRKGGKYKVTGRGRTSVGSHSFSQRTNETILTKRLATNVSTPKLSLVPHYIPMNEASDETIGTYAISFEGLCNWEDYDGYERAIEAHDNFVSRATARNESIYHWSGVHVFEEMQRYGLFNLSRSAVRSSMFNLKRTAYFGSIGLFQLSDSAFTELASLSSQEKSYSDKMGKFDHLYVQSIMPMKDYRAFKAKQLLKIREGRNSNRQQLKRDHNAYKNDALSHDLQKAELHFLDLFTDLEKQVHYYERHRSVNGYGYSAILAYVKYLSHALTEDALFARFLSSKTKKIIKNDLNAKQQSKQLRIRLHNELKGLSILSSYSIEWSQFNKGQISIKKKPVEYTTSVIW